MLFMDLVSYILFNFFIYGFLGWILENTFSYVVKKHFQTDGFLNGPFKPMYAIAMIIIILLYTIYKSNLSLIIIGIVVPTTVEYITGVLMRKYFNKNYWDYSDLKYNYKGIICLVFSFYWTILTFITLKYIQPYIVDKIYISLKSGLSIILIMLMAVLILDEVITLKKFKGNSKLV